MFAFECATYQTLRFLAHTQMEFRKSKFDGSVDQAVPNLFRRRSSAAISLSALSEDGDRRNRSDVCRLGGCLGEESILVRLSRCVDTKAFPRLPGLYLAQTEPDGEPRFFARQVAARRGPAADTSNN
jgi:hypothetical protein